MKQGIQTLVPVIFQTFLTFRNLETSINKTLIKNHKEHSMPFLTDNFAIFKFTKTKEERANIDSIIFPKWSHQQWQHTRSEEEFFNARSLYKAINITTIFKLKVYLFG